MTEIEQKAFDQLTANVERLRKACIDTEFEVQQTLGKALKYPPPPEGGNEVFVYPHVAATLALEMVDEYERAIASIQRVLELLQKHGCDCDGPHELGLTCEQQGHEPCWAHEVERSLRGPADAR